MYTKYALIIFGSFFVVNIIFIYMMISGKGVYFFTQLKWFMRITAPFIIFYLFYLGIRDRNKKDL